MADKLYCFIFVEGWSIVKYWKYWSILMNCKTSSCVASGKCGSTALFISSNTIYCHELEKSCSWPTLGLELRWLPVSELVGTTFLSWTWGGDAWGLSFLKENKDLILAKGPQTSLCPTYTRVQQRKATKNLVFQTSTFQSCNQAVT